MRGQRIQTKILHFFAFLSEAQAQPLYHPPLHHILCLSSSPFLLISSFYSSGDKIKRLQPRIFTSLSSKKKKKSYKILPLTFCLNQRHPWASQRCLLAQRVWVPSDTHTEEAVPDKAQTATQH